MKLKNLMLFKSFSYTTSGQGLYEITAEIDNVISNMQVSQGLCNIFIQHTSASLTIQENADPTAKRDLENWINKFVPENAPYYTHTAEGADDMPSHIKSVLTNTSLVIPVINERLALGTWQGVYLWEHRRMSHKRNIVVSVCE